MDVAAHIIVKGRVQGVSYRYFTIDRANSLGLTGWVRHVPDGTVEVWAEGDHYGHNNAGEITFAIGTIYQH